MTSTNNYLQLFEDYINGDMDALARRAFEEALEHDREMRAAWEEYNAMMQAFSDKEAIALRLQLEEAYSRQSHDYKLKYMPRNLWFRLSAAGVLILIVLSIWYFIGQREETPSFSNNNKGILTDSTSLAEGGRPDSLTTDRNAQNDSSTAEDIPQKQIACLYDREEYQISAVYAELLHSVYRSSWFHLLTPADSVIFAPGDSLQFIWETNIKDSLYFDVLDRHGSVIFKQKGAITSPFIYKPKLPPAIYMFRFATQNEPIWMGVMMEVE
jgi:hypothetical protein